MGPFSKFWVSGSNPWNQDENNTSSFKKSRVSRSSHRYHNKQSTPTVKRRKKVHTEPRLKFLTNMRRKDNNFNPLRNPGVPAPIGALNKKKANSQNVLLIITQISQIKTHFSSEAAGPTEMKTKEES